MPCWEVPALRLIRVFFEKRDRAKYISHLDLTRCMTRAFARTDIPVWFTEGFNPHVYMTFALPIPLGFEGLRESFDFKLTEDGYPFTRVGEQLNAALPPDIRVLEAAPAVMKPEAIVWAEYRITLYDSAGGEALAADWERLMAKPAIPVEKKTKHKTQELDLRPLITQLGREAGAESLTLTLRLPGGGAMNLNPNLLLGALWADRGGEAAYVRVLRTAILTEELAPFA